MGAHFNADEIFAIAEQIERNGGRFYRAAAKKFPHAEKILNELAAMEDEHLAIFGEMRRELTAAETESNVFDPDGEAALYLSALAGDHVFDTKKDPSTLLAGQESETAVFRVAIGLEKDSIVFYLGMKELVAKELGREKIDAIIREEMGHITLLRGLMA